MLIDQVRQRLGKSGRQKSVSFVEDLRARVSRAEQQMRGTQTDEVATPSETPCSRFAFVAPQMIDQSAWSGYYDMRSPPQLQSLGRHVHSAYHNRTDQVQPCPEHAELRGDLERQFAGRGEDEGKGTGGVDGEGLEDRDGEGDGLARASMGGSDAVPACILLSKSKVV